MSRAESLPATDWTWPPLRFRLRSNDPELLRKADALFRATFRREQDTVPDVTVAPQHAELACIRLSEENGNGDSPRWKIRLNGDAEAPVFDSLDRALGEIEFHAIQKLIEHPASLPGLHAALLGKEGRGVIVAGPYEAGKSTLACALWQAGWSFLCDDATLIDGACGMAFPTPRRVSMRHTSRALIGEELWGRILATPSSFRTRKGFLFHPHEIDGRPRSDSVRLRAIVFLAREGIANGPAEVKPLDPAHALMALLPYCNGVGRFGTSAAIRHLRPIAETVPVYDMGRGPLSEMVRQVERLFEDGEYHASRA